MRVLAIDPGTKCGWALKDNGTVKAGTWKLENKQRSGGGMRYLLLRNKLNEIGPVDAVFFEDVVKHAGTAAAHVYGGLVATVMTWCEEWEPTPIPYMGVSVGTIKKHATGKGNAKKPAMIAAAKSRWPGFKGDDNEADARWLLDWALKNGIKAPDN